MHNPGQRLKTEVCPQKALIACLEGCSPQTQTSPFLPLILAPPSLSVVGQRFSWNLKLLQLRNLSE